MLIGLLSILSPPLLMTATVGDIQLQKPTFAYHYAASSGAVHELNKLDGEDVFPGELVLSYSVEEEGAGFKEVRSRDYGQIDHVYLGHVVEMGQLLAKVRLNSIIGTFNPKTKAHLQRIALNHKYWFCYQSNQYPVEINYISTDQAFVTITTNNIDGLSEHATLVDITLSEEPSECKQSHDVKQ